MNQGNVAQRKIRPSPLVLRCLQSEGSNKGGECDSLPVLGFQTHPTELEVTNNRVNSLDKATAETGVESGCPAMHPEGRQL